MAVFDYDHALVRTLPRAYARAYEEKGIQIDSTVAGTQHAAYVDALKQTGVAVTRLPPAEDFYDCVFVEDTVIVWRDRALITRMAEHREGEQPAVAATLESSHIVSHLPAGARLEGGDVLHADTVTYVGLTQRTNESGAKALADFLAPFRRPVVPLAVTGTLHLKTVATYLGEGAMLVEPGHLDSRAFAAHDVIATDPAEHRCANCLRVRDTLIVPARCRGTLARVRRFAKSCALRVIPLDLSEFEKGDGSVTCLSVLWRER